MLNDVDFLLKFVVVSLVFGVLEVLFELRKWQSIGASRMSQKDPPNVVAHAVLIGLFGVRSLMGRS